MLKTAEAEFFGEKMGADVAEAKPAAVTQQAFFKPLPSASASAAAAAGSPPSAEAMAQSKTAMDKSGTIAGSRKQSASGTASRGTASSRRPAGNKALDHQPFDLAAVQSLTGASKRQERGGKAGADLKRFVGGARFWTGLESATRILVLLLLGAGVGGLLLPQGRAAIALAKYEAEYFRANSDRGVDSRARLEAFLLAEEVIPSRVNGIGYTDHSGEEFAQVSSSTDSTSSRGNREDSTEEMSGAKLTMDGVCGSGSVDQDGGECVAELEMGNGLDDAVDEGVISAAAGWFLSHVERLVGWAHYFSTTVMPIGLVNRTSCVPAIVLAVLVRLIVATIFAGARGALGLPAFPPAGGGSKPGMVLGLVLARFPSLGKLLAFGVFVMNLFADTTLVVAGTVLTLAVFLGWEQETGPVGYAGSLVGGVGRLVLGVSDDDNNGDGFKEL